MQEKNPKIYWRFSFFENKSSKNVSSARKLI
jgi:hypothetical protein